MKELNFTFERDVGFDADRAYQITKDALPELLQPIDALTLTDESLSEDEKLVHYERCWGVNVLQPLPAFVARLIPMNDVKIDEVSDWCNEQRRAAFTLAAIEYPDVLQTCHGTLHVHDRGEQARLDLSVHTALELSNIAGLPGFIARRLENQAERVGERVINTKMDRAEEMMNRYIERNTETEA